MSSAKAALESDTRASSLSLTLYSSLSLSLSLAHPFIISFLLFRFSLLKREESTKFESTQYQPVH